MTSLCLGDRRVEVGRIAAFPPGAICLDFRGDGDAARLLRDHAGALRALLTRENPFEDGSRARSREHLRARLVLFGYGVASELTRVQPTVVRTELPEDEEVPAADPAEAPFVAAEVAVSHDPQEVEASVDAETEPTAIEIETEADAPEVEVEIEAEGSWEPQGVDITVGGGIEEEELQA